MRGGEWKTPSSPDTSLYKVKTYTFSHQIDFSEFNMLKSSDLSWSTILGYGVGHIFNDICASMWFTYLLLFFQKVSYFGIASKLELIRIFLNFFFIFAVRCFQLWTIDAWSHHDAFYVFKILYQIYISAYIQGYPQRMRLQRRLYGINTVCFLKKPATLKLLSFFVKKLNKPFKDFKDEEDLI